LSRKFAFQYLKKRGLAALCLGKTAVGPIDTGLMPQDPAQSDFLFTREFIFGYFPRFRVRVDVLVQVQFFGSRAYLDTE
jgi:hypothetical protein